jgi:hypothetical protein
MSQLWTPDTKTEFHSTVGQCVILAWPADRRVCWVRLTRGWDSQKVRILWKEQVKNLPAAAYVVEKP